MGKCILVCAGEFVPIEILVEEGDFVIAVDGGFRYCQMLGILPDLILGDMDSASEEERLLIEEIEQDAPERVHRLKPEKDDTDTLSAVREGLERGYRKFLFLRSTGWQTGSFYCQYPDSAFLKKAGSGRLYSHGPSVNYRHPQRGDYLPQRRGGAFVPVFPGRKSGEGNDTGDEISSGRGCSDKRLPHWNQQ